MSDLLELADRVEDGQTYEVAEEICVALQIPVLPCVEWVQNALAKQSIDAARALHNAVLPGWDWELSDGFCRVMSEDYVEDTDIFIPNDYVTTEILEGKIHCGQADKSSAAWLAAILRAKHEIKKETK